MGLIIQTNINIKTRGIYSISCPGYQHLDEIIESGKSYNS